MRGFAPIHGLLLVMFVSLAAGSAASDAREDSALRAQLKGCLEIPSALRRLDCFDRLARNADNGQPIAGPDMATPPAGRDADAHSTSPRADSRAPSADRNVHSSVIRLEQRPRGEWVFHLQNGQVWTEIEPGRARYQEGAEVRISRTLFGSYMLSVEGSRATRVRRLQ